MSMEEKEKWAHLIKLVGCADVADMLVAGFTKPSLMAWRYFKYIDPPWDI
jgi:hypothetical protein